jgi:hypothetical protein
MEVAIPGSLAMLLLDRRTLILGGFALSSGGAAARQAPGDEPPPPTVFSQVVPHPTGENGYEELVRAVDALKRSRLWREAELAADPEPGLSLAAKRRVLQDPPVLRCLDLVRRGLAKPVRSPRETLNSQTLLPELAGFRSIARLLSVQQYVFMADGRGAEALGSLRTGLRVAYLVQTDTLISGLVGVAISGTCVRSTALHLEQFSAGDCERLYQICLDRLAAPDPLPAIVEAERRGQRGFLDELATGDRKQLEGLFGVAGLDPSKPEGSAAIARLQQTIDEVVTLRENPGAFKALLADTGRQMDAYCRQYLELVRQPPWQRARLEPTVVDGLPGRLTELLSPSFNRVGDRYSQESAMLRLLACHAAVLRYRWEYDRLPPSLAALNLGELVLDPFTGQPLQYQVVGRRYRLGSIGPEAGPNDAGAVDGRRPVSLTPD